MEQFCSVGLCVLRSAEGRFADETTGVLCYMSTKVLLYYFLVEKVYIIRNPWESRLKDKLYLFNVFGVILPYVVLVILSFVYRIAYIDNGGKCIIGINKHILFPLTSFEIVLNVSCTFEGRKEQRLTV